MAIITRQPEIQQPTPQPGQPNGAGRNLAGRIALALIAVAALAGAVVFAVTSGHSGSQSSMTHTPPTPAASTPSPPPSTGPVASIPGATTGGDPALWPAAQSTPPSLDGLYTSPPDFASYVRSLQNYIDWAYSHPDPSLVPNYMFASGSYYKGQVNDLTFLKTNGWHAPPNPTEIDFVKVTLQPKPIPPFNGKPVLNHGHPSYSGGAVVIVFNFPGYSMLDQQGNAVKAYPATGQVAYLWTLAQGTNDGRWRIADEQRLNPPGGIAALEQQ
jgi:hypothetical protein